MMNALDGANWLLQVTQKHMEVYQRPFGMQAGKPTTFLPVEAQEVRSHMAVDELMFKH